MERTTLLLNGIASVVLIGSLSSFLHHALFYIYVILAHAYYGCPLLNIRYESVVSSPTD